MEKIINSVEEMMKLWYELAIWWHHKVLLYGDLWAGKTHFTKWWVMGLDDKKAEDDKKSNTINHEIIKHNVNSPTYTYYQKYGDILHIDMYRLAEYSDLISKWILDQITDHEYMAIERPRHESAYIDKSFTKIYIDKIDEESRMIRIEKWK